MFIALAIEQLFAANLASAQEMSTSGASGQLNIPTAVMSPEGSLSFGYSNFREGEYRGVSRSDNFLFGLGLSPHVELSGRIADYAGRVDQQNGIRDISANLKLGLPKLFRGMPALALGVNDVAGGAVQFKSHYAVATDEWGPIRLSLGRKLRTQGGDGWFGGGEYRFGQTGLSLALERDVQVDAVGVRYRSLPMRMLGNATLLATLQHASARLANSDDRWGRSSLLVQLVLPLASHDGSASRTRVPNEPVWTPPPPAKVERAPSGSAMVSGAGMHEAPNGEANLDARPAPPSVMPVANRVAQPHSPAGSREALTVALADQLQRLGFERVRLGWYGRELVAEWEDHRFKHNDVDAVGLSLGILATGAGDLADRLTVRVKKLNLQMYRVSVNAPAYREFIRTADHYASSQTLELTLGGDVRPLEGATEEGNHGWSRVRLSPSLVKFVATERGLFDYSLAAQTDVFVPLWKGAQFSAQFLSTVSESDDVKEGFLGFGQQRNGMRAAVVSQMFWLTPRLLNVLSVGRIQYEDWGMQNETHWYLPREAGRIRAHYTRVRQHGTFRERLNQAGGLSYQFSSFPLGLQAEAGYQRYQGGDRGPFVQLSRWFGDVQAQAFVRKSEQETRVGFGLAFPLTPRRGMLPGVVQLEGLPSYQFALQTRWARDGECNCIVPGVVQEYPMVFSSRVNLLNQDRLSRDYFISQLARMREAYFAFSNRPAQQQQ